MGYGTVIKGRLEVSGCSLVFWSQPSRLERVSSVPLFSLFCQSVLTELSRSVVCGIFWPPLAAPARRLPAPAPPPPHLGSPAPTPYAEDPYFWYWRSILTFNLRVPGPIARGMALIINFQRVSVVVSHSHAIIQTKLGFKMKWPDCLEALVLTFMNPLRSTKKMKYALYNHFS